MISKFSVKRPYTVIVGVILVIVLGVVSFTRMTTDLLPDMNLPYALLITMDVGASPEEVEVDVTAPIEASMATTSSIKNVSSVSYDNYSMVILEYEGRRRTWKAWMSQRCPPMWKMNFHRHSRAWRVWLR